jgi:hypothetical protein
MPRTPNNIDPEILSSLKEEVLIVYNQQLKRSVDCDKLAGVVSRKTNQFINGISFKRLYGFTKYPFNPSYQTLDILAHYVGKKDWYSYQQSFGDPSDISNSELELMLSVYNFDFINQVNNYEGGIQSVSRQIAIRLRENPETFKRVIDRLAINPNAQIFFIEHFPDYDNLNNFYHIAFEKYLEHKKTKEAQLFGNCILFLKSFWENDELECARYIKRINEIGVSDEFHPYVIGRYYSCNILYKHFFGDANLEYLISKVNEVSERMPNLGKHFIDFPAFQYIVSEALLHCEKFEECISMIDESFDRYPLRMEFVRKGYYRQLQLFKSIAFWELGKHEESQLLLEKINPNTFYFFSKKYYTVLFLLQKLRIENDEVICNHTSRLIKEMNNLFLAKQFEIVTGRKLL